MKRQIAEHRAFIRKTNLPTGGSLVPLHCVCNTGVPGELGHARDVVHEPNERRVRLARRGAGGLHHSQGAAHLHPLRLLLLQPLHDDPHLRLRPRASPRRPRGGREGECGRHRYEGVELQPRMKV